MKAFAAVLVVLFAAYPGCQPTSVSFRGREFIKDHIPFLAKYEMEGKCQPEFEPYAVDFNFENTPYLLLVSSGSMVNPPVPTLDEKPIWYGNSTDIFIFIDAYASDFTVIYNASIGTVKDNNAYERTECSITAKNSGYIVATAKEFLKDHTGSDVLHKYSVGNWALVVHTIDRKSYGTWDISASCPGADSRLVSELVDTVKKVDLVKQRDIARETTRKCADLVLKELEVANYITIAN